MTLAACRMLDVLRRLSCSQDRQQIRQAIALLDALTADERTWVLAAVLADYGYLMNNEGRA